MCMVYMSLYVCVCMNKCIGVWVLVCGCWCVGVGV